MTCLIVGDANADISASIEFFPREGDDVGVKALGFRSGGMGANVAVAMARLGETPRLLARVGEDPAADVALRAANNVGVDLSFLQRDPRIATGLCFAAISPGGERTFFSYRGANVALRLPDVDAVFRDLTGDLRLNVKHVHIAGHALLEGEQRQTALALIAEANRRKVRVSIDLCLPLIRARAPEIMTLMPQIFATFANAQELALLGTSLGLVASDSHPFDSMDAALLALTSHGAPLVVAKLGAMGSRIAIGSSRIDIRPLPIVAVNTTGAGDGFVGAFLFALLRGCSPEIAARIGNVVGALIASRPGTMEAESFCDDVLANYTKLGPREDIATLFSPKG